MSTSRNFDRICAAVLVLSLLVTVLFLNGSALGLQAVSASLGYEERLFDTSEVHTLDLVIDDWDGFLENCESEEYVNCAVVIDGEAFRNVGLRAKGNTSLSTVRSLDSQRYSLKIEFDHYETGKTYHGLDKLCLNNIIQDNTYLKDYLTYRMMSEFGADAPLCSFAYITVNGEDWGLYLAVEGLEDSFLRRTYGAGYGDLYKPDSMSFGGGGPGHGRDFNMEDFRKEDSGSAETDRQNTDTGTRPNGGGPGGMNGGPGGGMGGGMPGMPGGFDPSALSGSDGQFDLSALPNSGGQAGPFNRNRGGSSPFDFGGMGSDDVKLVYTDDSPDSYANIFNNAKTDVTAADKARLIASLKQIGERENLEDVLDIDEVLRYFVVHNYVVNGDSYTGNMIHNYYLYEDSGRFSMIPWDYNLAFGAFQGNSAYSAVNDPIDTPLSVSGDGTRPMADWYVQGDEWTELYHRYFADFLDTVDPQSILTEARTLIAPYVEKDPTAFCTYEEFQTGADTLSEFCKLRTESVRGQLNGTIPATDDGQNADSSALISADNITISDMGSMNHGGGPGGGMDGGNDTGFGGGRGQRSGSSGNTENGAGSDGASPDNGTPDSGGANSSGAEIGFPDFGPGGMDNAFPGMPGEFPNFTDFTGGSDGSFPDFTGFGSGSDGGFSGGFPGLGGDFQPEQMRAQSDSGAQISREDLLLFATSAAALLAALLLVRKPWKRY